MAAQELEIGYFDPQSNMEQAVSENRLYFPRDKGHMNAQGNDQIAQWVFEYLIEYQYIPKASEVIRREYEERFNVGVAGS